jgi:hypothetical protein
MTDQATLFDQPQTTARTFNRDILLGADEWIAANPEGWERFCWLMKMRKAQGRRMSPKSVVEEMREDFDLRTPTAHRWKFDNSITSGLGRRFCDRYPELAAFVPMKRSRADR